MFIVAYCYITSKFANFFFLLDYLKDLIFHDTCYSTEVILGDFIIVLAAVILKKNLKY